MRPTIQAAVDEVITNNEVSSGPAFVECAEVGRVKDGPVVGQPAAAPEIAVTKYLTIMGQKKCSSTQPKLTHPRNSPDNKPRFLPQLRSAIEPC